MPNDPLPAATSAHLYELTQSVAAARGLEDIYEAALTCLEGALGVPKSSILLFDLDGVLRFKAWRHLSPEYREAVEGHSPWTPEDHDAQPVLVPEVTTDLSLAPLLEPITREGIRALAFIPLATAGKLLGKFMLYHREPHQFTTTEVMLARTIAANVAFAIDQHRGRETRQHLEGLFRSRVAGISQTDAQGHYVAINDRYCEIVGRPREQLLGRADYLSITHPEDLQRFNDLMATLRAGEDHITIERRITRPDGRLAWIWSSVSALRDTAGNLSGTISLITDITPRKEAGQKVRESEQRLRDLIEAVSIAVYMTDAEGRITLYNEAAKELWGREPVIGQDLWCGSWRIYDTHNRPVPLDQCPMAICLKQGVPVRATELIIERPDGKRVEVQPYPTPLRDSDGNLIGAVNVLVDISGQKQMQKDLQEAIRAKDDFLGQVSHELRTPITQIAGNAEILRRRWRDLPADIQESSLEEIHTQTIRIQRLVENMMVLSRFERGVLPPTEPHLLQRLVDQTVAEFRSRFPSTRLEVHVEDALPPVETNPSTIDQVIWNLLTNAQKYGPSAGPIELRARAHRGLVEVQVLDEGPGVPEEDLDRIFEPYFRSSAIPAHAAGLGLGLSVCRRLIEAQGGEMLARRRPEKGMEFVVRLRGLSPSELAELSP